MLPENFNKQHIDPNHKRFCLGTQKLGCIWKNVNDQGDYRNGDRIFIPFGGPGSMSFYFDMLGIPTISGDIESLSVYNSPWEGLDTLRKEHQYTGGTQAFCAWDSEKLPFGDLSHRIAIVNPPYGINCNPKSANPLELVISTSNEIHRVLAPNGAAYFVFPNEWSTEFQIRTEQKMQDILIKKISKNISSNLNTKNPLCLMRMKKGG